VFTAPVRIRPIFPYRSGFVEDELFRLRVEVREGDKLVGEQFWTQSSEFVRRERWDGHVEFSSSDGSDPRTNGRNYSAVIHYRMRASLLWLIVPLGTYLLLTLIARLPGWAKLESLVPESTTPGHGGSIRGWLL